METTTQSGRSEARPGETNATGTPHVGNTARRVALAVCCSVCCSLAFTSAASMAQLLPNDATTYTANTPLAGGAFGTALTEVPRTNGQTWRVLVGTSLSDSDNFASLDVAGNSLSMESTDGRVVAAASCDSYRVFGFPFHDAALRGGPPQTNTGVVRIFSGNFSLIAEWDQENWAGQTLEIGDQFGSSLTSGDFNGDGACDIAVGSPYEDVGAIVDAGAVYIAYGPLNGTPTFEGPIVQSTSGIAGGNEDGDRFGEVLARGPRIGGYDSLLIGAPREDVFDVVDAGSAWWIPGSIDGLQTDSSSHWWLPELDVLPDGDEQFGSAFAIGDFNGDGTQDVAIGAPDDAAQTGLVTILHGPPVDAPAMADVVLIEPAGFDSGSSAGTVSPRGFGSALAAGEWTGDDADELLVGAPNSSVGGISRAGAVYWSRGVLGGAAELVQLLVQSDLPGESSETGDRFGEVLLTAQPYRSDAKALLIGVPQEILATRSGERGFALNEGVVHVIPTGGRLQEVDGYDVESYGCGPLYDPNNPQCFFIQALGNPTVDVAGDIAFTGVQFDATHYLKEVPQQAYGGAAYQFGSEAALSPQGTLLTREQAGGERLVAFDASQGERTLLQLGATDGDLQWLGFGPYQLDAADNAYVIADAERVPNSENVRALFRSTTLQPGSFQPLIALGDPVAGSISNTVFDLLSSADVAHDGTWATMAQIGFTRGITQWALVVDGTVVWEQLDEVDGIVIDETPSLFAINSSAWAIGLPYVDHQIKVFDQEGIVFASDEQLEGRALALVDPGSMALNERGDLVVAWKAMHEGNESFVSLSCAEGSPTQVLLAEGDRVDAPYGDATVARLATGSDTRPERTPQGTVVLHAELWHDDGGPPFDAILEVAAACPLFYDGFEAGNTSAWSAAAP